ncbi:MAG: Ig-like domain-containing protein, partial [Candidatus Methanofastidiosia archaeon]
EVTYTDADNDDPVSLVVDITGVGTFNMVELDPADQNFKNGKVYYYVYTGGFPIGTHSYTITADDGTDTTSLGGTGPEIPVGDCPPSPPPSPPSPVINIYPISGTIKTWVTISGNNFAPSEDNITVTFEGTPVQLTPLGSTQYGSSPGTVKANASGAFSAKFKVPISRPGPKTVDAYGNTTPASNVPNRTFTVICILPPPYPPPAGFQPPTDTISPQSIITYPKTNAKLKGNYITVRGTASDNNEVVKVEVSFDNGSTWYTASGTDTWSYRWRLPTDGIYTVRSRATDNEGNAELIGDKVTVVIDNTPPEVTITTELESITSQTEFKLTGTVIDNDMVKRVEITTDGGDNWTPLQANGEWTYTWIPSDGEYIIQVRAWDDVSHSGYSEQVSIIIDTTPPELYIDTIDGTLVTEETFIITGRASDKNGVKSVQISFNDQSFENVDGLDSWEYIWVVPDALGDYRVVVKAQDTAGNETPQEITLSVGVPPTEGILPAISSRQLYLILIVMAGVLIGAAVILLVVYFRG